MTAGLFVLHYRLCELDGDDNNIVNCCVELCSHEVMVGKFLMWELLIFCTVLANICT